MVPHALARIPKAGEARGNMAAGGKPVAQPLSARDREIAEYLAPKLAAQGLFLVGLDVIGDSLTEINVTSPTGFMESPRRRASTCRPSSSNGWRPVWWPTVRPRPRANR